MRTILILLLTLLSFNAYSDWLASLYAYENKNYPAAKAGFQELLPLGNADAAFNLGVMAYYGEGQQVNITEALQFFLLAEKLQHDQVASIVKRIYQEADTEQRALAESAAATAFAKIIIKQNSAPYQLSMEPGPMQISAPMPDIPDDVSRKHPFGYIVVQFVVNGDGKVQVVDAVDGFPEGAFDSYTYRAMRRWQFEATGKPHLLSKQLNFWVTGSMNARSANQVLHHQNLWAHAQIGSGKHQEMLGSVLNLIEMVSGALVYVAERSVESEIKPDVSEWFSTKKQEIVLPSLDGVAHVQTNERGVIVRLLNVDQLKQPEPEKLMGVRISGAGEGLFRLSNSVTQGRSFSRVNKKELILVKQYVPVNEELTSLYWWKKAAVNGDRRAQRILGAQRQDWQFYLLQQGDPVATAWHGARLILDGERSEGQALLQQAAAAGYSQATELLQALSAEGV
ncbi:hypothetical protein WG68_18380 [Arsukibacterium ikkense]|uniref:TonB C-terminal domain-containing protein n=1 Tax=Arsukibacterium ikkense TaxID=336831 RepID=A0A0M2UZZ0_9GAMM|nr:energy transducer TonB [Arsukibacterium ikkense]KKO43906.1 hypothetical protein WG68_18380 [Arsukibacterium ikkense]